MFYLTGKFKTLNCISLPLCDARWTKAHGRRTAPWKSTVWAMTGKPELCCSGNITPLAPSPQRQQSYKVTAELHKAGVATDSSSGSGSKAQDLGEPPSCVSRAQSLTGLPPTLPGLNLLLAKKHNGSQLSLLIRMGDLPQCKLRWRGNRGKGGCKRPKEKSSQMRKQNHEQPWSPQRARQ